VPVWIGGGLVCVVEFVLFVISRTAGLPGGYLEAWVGAPEDLLGLASLFVEVVFLATAAASLRRTPGTMNTHTGRVAMPIHDRTTALR
jgi:hypothetical protein